MNSTKVSNKAKLIILFSFWLAAIPAFAQEMNSLQILKIAGIPPAPDQILQFIDKGSPGAVNMKAVNEKSIPATQLAISGIQELTRLKYQPAIPILIRTAQGNLTIGEKSLVDYDSDSVSPSLREGKKNQLSDFLRFNALNALGFMENPDALPTLQEIFNNSSPGLFKINAALGMACLDHGEGIDYLVRQMERDNLYLARESASALSFITGMDLDFGTYTPISRRDRTIKTIKKWWKENQARFHPNGKKILERRLNIKTMPPPDMRSVRDLVRAAANYSDFDNRMKSLDAREKLTEMGNSILPELKMMCLDKEEDLNIRIEAIRRYTRLASWNNAKEVLKKGKKDKNPEIRDVCKDLLKNPPVHPE